MLNVGHKFTLIDKIFVKSKHDSAKTLLQNQL